MSQIDSIHGPRSYQTSEQQFAVSRFMNRTYGWMFVGLLITGFVSAYIASSQSAIEMIFSNKVVFYGVMIAEVLLVVGLSAMANRISASTALLGFLAYSALNGITFSGIFLIYTLGSISQVFMIAAGMFGGLALYGSVTKKDLTGMGAFVGMGLWGLILVGLVNMFVKSEALSLGLSAAGVLIFAGLTAYDAQRLRALAISYASQRQGVGTQAVDKGAIFGALTLYFNFINLFLSLLNLFGKRR